jgi:hypothetical protein
MQSRVDDTFSQAKLGRWLGYIQGVAVNSGYATLDEMKRINFDNRDTTFVESLERPRLRRTAVKQLSTVCYNDPHSERVMDFILSDADAVKELLISVWKEESAESAVPKTLGELARLLSILSENGITRESVEYVLDRVSWPEEEK